MRECDRIDDPTRHEREPTQWGDRAKFADPAQGQRVEASTKDEDSDEQQQPGRAGTWGEPGTDGEADRQEAERVDELVEDRALIDRGRVGIESVLERVRAKRADQDGEGEK